MCLPQSMGSHKPTWVRPNEQVFGFFFWEEASFVFNNQHHDLTLAESKSKSDSRNLISYHSSDFRSQRERR